MPDHHTANFLIQQAISRYERAMVSWTSQVLSARRAEDAFRLAANAPMPDALIRSMRSLTARVTGRERGRVERHLEALADAITDPAERARVMRLAQGHWPRLWHRIDVRRRMSQAV